MSVDSFKRKLTAILYCDVAGYSRLSGSDEEGTHRRVMALLDFASEQIEAAGGVVLRFSGDAILAEFDSAVAAVRAAASIQQELWQQNRLLEQPERVQIRIGVNIVFGRGKIG